MGYLHYMNFQYCKGYKQAKTKINLIGLLIPENIYLMNWKIIILFLKQYLCCEIVGNQNKEEGKDQELIQSNTTPDPGHTMGKWQKHKKT